MTQTAGTMASARVINRRSHGRSRMLMNPSMTICPASVPVSVEFCPEASSARANKMLAPVTPSSARQQFVGVLDRRHILMARPVKRRRRENENGAVDEQREHERHGRINRGELDGLAFAAGVLLVFARLHDGGMQIKIMRHDGRADDADADVKHARIFEDLRARERSPAACRRCRASTRTVPRQNNRRWSRSA